MADKKGKKDKNKSKNGKNKASTKKASSACKGKKSGTVRVEKDKVVSQKSREETADRRDQNYSAAELDVLVRMCKQKIDLLESNLSAEITREVKDDAWKAITTGVNV